MFKAILVVCSLTSPDTCETWVDAIGPYPTIAACETRALEMSKDAFTYLNGWKGQQSWKGKSFNCNKLPKGML
jgi:hypothetical protein